MLSVRIPDRGPEARRDRPDPRLAAAAASLASTPGVRAVIADRYATRDCGEGPDCQSAFVGSCADLAVLMPGLGGCRDDRPAIVRLSYGRSSIMPARLTLRGPSIVVDRSSVPSKVTLRLDRDAITLVAPDNQADLEWSPDYSLFVPASTPGIDAMTGATQQWTMVLDGGPAAVRRRCAVRQEPSPRRGSGRFC